MYLSNIFALFFIVFIYLLNFTNSEFRIANGRKTSTEERKYVVSIQHKDSHFCAGALVTEIGVVTSGNCAKKFISQKIQMTVVAGKCSDGDEGQQRIVERVSVPKLYRGSTKNMDVAVLKMFKPFDLGPTIETIPLCCTNLESGTRMRITGWGSTNRETKDLASELQTTEVTILSDEICTDRFTIDRPKSTICAKGHLTGACYGDSGAPGVVEGTLCAVVSDDTGCDVTYSTYTNLTNEEVREFLNDKLEL